MKLRFLILTLLFSLQVTSNAQEYSKKFGVLGKAETDLVSYTPDKSAEAVVLYDIGKSYFEQSNNGFDVILEKSTRIKILTEAGLKWAEIEIPFYQEEGIFEQVYDIEAYTYNPIQGAFTTTSFNPANMHDEKLNEYWTLKKLALPNVTAGSIIEYRYKIRSQYKFNLRDWEYQSRIPTIYSEYEVRMIPFYEYVWYLQGTKKLDSVTSSESTALKSRFGGIEYSEMIHKFIMKNIPAFKDEEFITSINDYIIKQDFQLAKITNTDGISTDIISTWPALIENILKDNTVTKFAKKCEKLTSSLFSPDSLANKSQKEKFDIIINYVKANFNWNKINSKYASTQPNDLLKDKIGNSADLNLLVVGLLNDSGIEAYPLFISTRGNGKIIYDYPFLNSFNYVIIEAVIDGQKILTDATEVLCPNNRVPSRCLNDKGLLIKKGAPEWVNLQSSLPSIIQTSISIDSIGINSHANTLLSAIEYDGLRYRNLYGEDVKKFAARGNSGLYSIDEPSVKVSNNFRKDQPYIVSFNSSCKTEIINNKIYISPFLDEPITDNPLKQSDRSYPIDMLYPVKRIYSSTINIPDGYRIDYVPQKNKILNELFELNYDITSNDKTINISFNYSYKKSVYEARDYLNLKYYFNEIIKKAGEKIVLVKI